MSAGSLETLCKLYLELANVVPTNCLSSRELALNKRIDNYGITLMMIAEGCENPVEAAQKCLVKYGIVGRGA